MTSDTPHLVARARPLLKLRVECLATFESNERILNIATCGILVLAILWLLGVLELICPDIHGIFVREVASESTYLASGSEPERLTKVSAGLSRRSRGEAARSSHDLVHLLNLIFHLVDFLLFAGKPAFELLKFTLTLRYLRFPLAQFLRLLFDVHLLALEGALTKADADSR